MVTTRALSLALTAVIAATALAGCTAARLEPSASPKVSTASWPTAQIYHTGRTSSVLTVPAGARSLHVDFSCTYGIYTVGPDLSIDQRNGSCGGAQSFDFDIHSIATGTRLTTELVVPDGTRLVADLKFSTAAFTPDATTAKQCAALSKIQEAYWNADLGYEHGDVSAEQWTQLTASAKTEVAVLAARAKQHPSSTGLLGNVIPAVADWLSGPGDHPGGVLHAPPGDYTAAGSLVGQICTANGTPIIVNSKYGG